MRVCASVRVRVCINSSLTVMFRVLHRFSKGQGAI